MYITAGPGMSTSTAEAMTKGMRVEGSIIAIEGNAVDETEDSHTPDRTESKFRSRVELLGRGELVK
jgi:hypothetical protein